MTQYDVGPFSHFVRRASARKKRDARFSGISCIIEFYNSIKLPSCVLFQVMVEVNCAFRERQEFMFAFLEAHCAFTIFVDPVC